MPATDTGRFGQSIYFRWYHGHSLSFLNFSTCRPLRPLCAREAERRRRIRLFPPTDGSMTPVSRAGNAGKPKSEWDYWLAMAVLTVLAFATRFYRIDYPNEVVFDEVHFGKVCAPAASRRPRRRQKGDPRLTCLTLLVRLVLSSAHVLLRCSPSVRKAALRLHGLDHWI
jgi:Dolichyl-phosphate-mannose--protein O-mannosyl transferase